ncbi:MAG: ankyrin repeat domain-containing protein [Flavisolibacter sp.]
MDSKELAFFFDACRRGDEKDVTKFCELFPELIDEKDAKGYTALIIAAYNNQTTIVSILLNAGANPDSQDLAGNSALMGASFRGYPEVAELLLNAGANPDLRNEQGAPALIFAATFGQLEIAGNLIKRGADKNLVDSRGKSALDHAVLQENEAMIALLSKVAGEKER